MRYVSTRDNTRAVSGADAIARGQAHDGGLYVPDAIPKLTLDEIGKLIPLSYPELAFCVTKLYLPEFTDAEIYEYTKTAYGNNFDTSEIAPLKTFGNFSFLELWHGPTCAFKDMALQYLPKLMSASLVKTGETKKTAILVATSGDTGKAALEGFKNVDGTSIIVFYPRDGVSDIQKLQMTTQDGANVEVCAVEGNFDDAQSGVKALFSDAVLRDELERKNVKLSSANSINWGRLLPQIVYYIYAYSQLVRSGKTELGGKVNFCVPTGNFGNILAGYIARDMGLPVNKLICASNANNVLTDFLDTGIYDRRRELIVTASPSMDILISSNLERLLYFVSDCDSALVKTLMTELSKKGRYSVDAVLKNKIGSVFLGGFCDDDATRASIAKVFNEYGYLIDPHTAVAYNVWSRLNEDELSSPHTVIVSTASPYKFCVDVLNALGADCPEGLAQFGALSELTGTAVPAPLSELDGKPVRFTDAVAADAMRGYVTAKLS